MAEETKDTMIPKHRFDEKNTQLVNANAEIARLKAESATYKAKADQYDGLATQHSELQAQTSASSKALSDYSAIASHFPSYSDAQHMIAQHAKAMQNAASTEQVDLATWTAHALENPDYVQDSITAGWLHNIKSQRGIPAAAAQPPTVDGAPAPASTQADPTLTPAPAAAPEPAPASAAPNGLPNTNGGVVQAPFMGPGMTPAKMNEIAGNPVEFRKFQKEHPTEYKRMVDAANRN